MLNYQFRLLQLPRYCAVIGVKPLSVLSLSHILLQLIWWKLGYDIGYLWSLNIGYLYDTDQERGVWGCGCYNVVL